ncbi:MAG: hypothetical protein ABIP30_00545 [Ferruginibacter sp.]
MKKYFYFTIFFLCFIQYNSFAQHSAGKDDIARAMRAGRVSIHTSKAMLEANESAVLDIKLLVTPVVNEQTLQTEGTAYPVDLPDGSDPNIPAAYHSSNWKIVQGGGSISSIEGNTCVYTAPGAAPRDKIMVISVDLNPTSTALPKIVLLQTIYFVNDETAIVINLPQGGFLNSKYITTTSGGMKVPTMQGIDPRVAGHISPALQAQMAQVQQAVNAAQANTGINLSSTTSNAMAYFDGKTGQTVVKLTKLTLQMDNGKDKRKTVNGKPAEPAGSYLTYCEISFTGHGVGTYTINDKPSGLGMMDGPTKGCGCGQSQKEAHCEGHINIKSIENGVMKGDFNSLVYTSDGKTLFQGTIYGKFTANIANLQQ